jgi:hypothetical protein
VQGQCVVFVFVSEVHEVCLCCSLVLVVLLKKQATKQSGKGGTVVCLLGLAFCGFGFGGFGAETGQIQKLRHYTTLLP